VEVKRLESTRRRTVRLVSRACVLVVGVVLALSVVPWRWTALLLPALSPFVAIGSAVAGRTLLVTTPLGLLVALLVVWRPRWFCRVACPVGLMIEQVGRLRPHARPRVSRVPPIGQWVVLLTLAGAVVGYPLLLWLDPLALFNGFFTGWRQPLNVEGLAVGIGLPLVLLLGLLWPFLWCRRLCPLGATQDLLALLRRLGRRREREALHAPRPGRSWPLARRSVLAMGVGAGAAAAAARWAQGSAPRPIRPPGSIDESRFAGVCIRCGNCIRACPERIIQPDLGRHGLAGLLTPVLSFDCAYCLEDCTRCGEVCPSGAIARLSLAQKQATAVGLAKIDMLACFLSQNIECGVCAGVCPYEAIEIDFDENTYESTITVVADKCTGCGACEMACMTSPKKAIRVYPLDSA